MRITFLGGADEVGASCTLVEVAGKRLLIDAGIRISPKSSRGLESSQLPDLQPISAIGGIDFLLVTHAHTDHTGALPLVVEQYPHVPVIMTRATEALVRVLQKDAQRIMKGNFDEEGELPLFDEVAVDRLLDAIQYVDFKQPLRLGEGLQVTYHVSGHIAGAALLVIESSEGTLVMSGDLSKSPQRTVESVRVPRIKADALVLESTYGGRLHANREAQERGLIEAIKRVTERGGKVLIPAFALGRAQEILQIIHAYRDQLNGIPIYADGMVRSVCEAYVRFKEILPQAMVKHAGDRHLFFRNNVYPVTSVAQRQLVVEEVTPLVVVASSGMLTGGASQHYAKYFAGDERNAIFLTGYQDEESPGKMLQKLMKDREASDEPTIRLGKDIVKVRCEVGSYSLSAHADEAELVSIAKALGAEDVMLVHGDASARHSLATALRQRGIVVTTPKVGTIRDLYFGNRPWAIGQKIQHGKQTDSVNLETLWNTVKDQSGNFFSAREFAQMWWGDGQREKEMLAILQRPDNLYFGADWRNKTDFRINSPEQVARAIRQRAIMQAHPDIVGKLVVLRNSNNQPRLGVVRSADIDRFEADAESSKGSHYGADALLWVIGNWQKTGETHVKVQLAELLKEARTKIEIVLPINQRQAVVQSGKAVNPRDLLPDPLPNGIGEQVALVAIVLALADDFATLEPDGLKPQRVIEMGQLEQNQARDLALSLFPEEARLRRVGIQVHRKQLTLFFDFPQVAEKRYADIIENLILQSGWDVDVNPTINQQGLTMAIFDLMPMGAQLIKSPSYFMDRREVSVEISGLEDPQAYERAYLELTGFKVILGKPKREDIPDSVPIGTLSSKQMEINAAYQLIKTALEPHGLYKVSLKSGQIMLSFVSPQLAERYTGNIQVLSQETGYMMTINPNPNQQQILLTVRQLCAQMSAIVRKGPGIHTDKGIVTISLANKLTPEQETQLQQAVEQQTGYQLVIE
jgi:Cft2 family RNA processing exonuclease